MVRRAVCRTRLRAWPKALGAAAMVAAGASHAFAQATPRAQPAPSGAAAGLRNSQVQDIPKAPATPSQQGDSQTATGGGLQTIVVTARRREENVEKIPGTITALQPAALQQQGITQASDLQFIAPSVQVTQAYTSLYTTYTVRGLATGVTTYFSDAPCCASAANIPFLDVNSVQVLDGPQGTLFGRSSAAGAVLINPQRPKFNQWGGFVDLTAGDYDRLQFTGVLNIPLIDDHLAVRIAVNTNNIDGYTNVLGSGNTLDGVANQQYRIGALFRWGKFENYLVADYLNINESGTSEILGGADFNYSLYNLPASAGPAEFGAVCQQAVSLGYNKDVNGCVSQRLGVLANIKQTLATEYARIQAGDVRTALPSFDGIGDYNKEQRTSYVDNAQFDAGTYFGTALLLKNIFSYEQYTAVVSGPNDGLGGVADEAEFPEVTSNGDGNQIGNVLTAKQPKSEYTANEEVQLHTDTLHGLFVGTLGGFFSYTQVPKQLDGSGIVYKYFGGVFTPNLGNTSATGFSNGGFYRESAIYGQGTIDFSKVGVHGLSLTGGYRYSQDSNAQDTFPEQYDYTTGHISPSSTEVFNNTRSHGYDYTVSLSEQVTPRFLVYGTISRAYVPGGTNGYQAGNDTLPNYTPTYGSETVLNKEFGFKWDLSLGGVKARINAAAYFDDFTDIAEEFYADVGGSTTYYFENAAGASLNGLEAQATVIPIPSLEISGGYNYNNAYYTNWISTDPLNLAQPGQSICVKSSPAGSCYVDLSNNPFANLPTHQGHITVLYRVPVDASLGKPTVSATLYGQTRVYYESDDARELEVEPSDLNAVSQAPYYTLRLRADWNNVKGTGWNLAAFINNVTNQLYANGKIEAPITSGFSVVNYAPPRMFGFEASRSFGGG